RVDQVGYLPGEAKVALVESDAGLRGEAFSLEREAPAAGEAFAGRLGLDRGAFNGVRHHFAADFSPVTQPGIYHLEVAGNRSPSFRIDAAAFGGLPELALAFFRVQRCGDTHPDGHAPCHLDDGRLPDGTLLDASGGWHDAGDTLKF